MRGGWLGVEPRWGAGKPERPSTPALFPGAGRGSATLLDTQDPFSRRIEQGWG
jgi:hypothetical protein